MSLPGQSVLIVEGPQDVECVEGDTTTFRCLVSPADLPCVQWCLNQTPLQPSLLHQMEACEGGRHSLTVRELSSRDSGVISVVAGDKRAHAHLLVKGKRLVPWL